MRIGELARRAGVNVETLRYYERRGLLEEPARSPNRHREYDEETVRFVKAVKEAQSLGFTLSEIEEHTRLTRSGGGQESIRIRLAQKIDEVDGKLASLQRVRDELARVLGCACDSLDHCTCGAAYLARGGKDPQVGGLLHVTNGESAGNTLRQTALGGAVLSWQDVLHEGPVPAVPTHELRRVRARFLSECGWGSERSLLDAFERRDRLYRHALEARTQVVLWFEHDLYDQLQLLQVLALAAETGWDGDSFSLVLVGSFPGRPDFHGLGELDADELESLWPARASVTDEQVALAVEAWGAVRAPAPTAVAAFLERNSSALPYLAAALRRLLEELPDAQSGLSRTERQLLEAVDGGASTPAEAFLACAAREEAPFAGDTWVFRTLDALGSLAEDVRLRRDVLAGRADRVELLGIDRWVGGTHLVPGAVWRRNGSELVAP
jgi:DNA-binding transcriptional MerR regulator